MRLSLKLALLGCIGLPLLMVGCTCNKKEELPAPPPAEEVVPPAGDDAVPAPDIDEETPPGEILPETPE